MAIIIVFQGGHLEALTPPGLPFTVSGALLAESPRQTLYNILCTIGHSKTFKSSYRNSVVYCPTRQSFLLFIGSLHWFPYPDNKEISYSYVLGGVDCLWCSWKLCPIQVSKEPPNKKGWCYTAPLWTIRRQDGSAAQLRGHRNLSKWNKTLLWKHQLGFTVGF